MKSPSRCAASKAARTAARMSGRKRSELLEVTRGPEQEHAAVPVIATRFEIGLRGGGIRFFDEAQHLAHAARRLPPGCNRTRFPLSPARSRRSPARRTPPPDIAARTASRNASASRTTWSEGNTSSSGSSPCAIACKAAAAIAGAVLRPTGSSMIAACSTPIWRSCSAARKRCSSLATTIGGTSTSDATRCQVSCSMVRSPASARNCLG